MNYEIKDNFLPKENLDILKKEIFSNYFPWYFQDEVNIHHKNHEEDLVFLSLDVITAASNKLSNLCAA